MLKETLNRRVVSVLVSAEHSASHERTRRLHERLTSKHYKHCLKFSESAVNNAGEDVPRENMFGDAFSLAQLLDCTPFSWYFWTWLQGQTHNLVWFWWKIKDHKANRDFFSAAKKKKWCVTALMLSKQNQICPTEQKSARDCIYILLYFIWFFFCYELKLMLFYPILFFKIFCYYS